MKGAWLLNITEQLAQYCDSMTFSSLPGEVVEMTRELYLDFVGLALRGAKQDSSSPVIQLIRKLSEGKSVVMGTSIQAGAEYAALANGCFAHSLELDDVINEASLHPAVAVFPAATAAAEIAGTGGKDLITASVAGYEIMARLGRALDPTEHYRRGFHPTGTCGTMAAAVTAAKVLGMGKKEIINALGIALSQAAASMEFLAEGAWTKRFHPGWAAHSGLIAALLAGEGFQAPQQPIEGRFGFLNAYSNAPNPELAVKDLGQSYLVMKTSIKPHACCRYNQSPIDGFLKIAREHGLKPEQVAEVYVSLVKTAFPIVVDPIESKRRPQNVVDAQFSLPYAAAVAISRGRAFLDDYTEDIINSSEIQELMSKVRCTHDPDLDEEFPQKWACRVSVQTKDGKQLEAHVDYPKGDPENPLTREEIVAKFNELNQAVDPKQRHEIIRQVQSLDQVSIPSFTRLLQV